MAEVLLRESVDNGRIRLLTLNRPDVMNALNTDLGRAIIGAIDEIAEDPTVRVIVLTGAGDRAFCTGADLKERNSMPEDVWLRQHRVFEEVHRKIRTCLKPMICAANGYALAGGFELAFSCDFVYASSNAKFGVPEVTRGIIPGVGGTQLLGRVLPRGRGAELLFTGGFISADQALAAGLVNRIFGPQELLGATMEVARQIASNSPLAIQMAKKAFRLGASMAIEDAIEFSLECYNRTVSHPDRIEGVQAFNEKRKAVFLDAY